MKSKVTESKIKKLIKILKYITERKELLELFEEISPRPPFEKLINNWLTNIESFTNKEEFIEDLTQFLKLKIKLFEKKDHKKLSRKFDKTYIHKEINNILNGVFVGEKLKNKGIQIVDIPTIGEETITGEVMVWENKGIEYFVKADDILKLDGKNPKAFASQIKNISLLMGMAQEQQYNNSTKEAKCEFTFSYYAERRGYSKEEVMKSGNFFNELKRDLLTGAYTTYRIDKVIIEGKEYIAHGIPNFYTLYEPKDHEIKWRVDFNNPYSGWIIKILNREAGQYFITNPKAIEDRVTTEKPYLFLFYMQLIKRKRSNLFTTPVKIGNLLKDMKIDEQILARPKECFKLLKECLIYFNQNYQPVPEIDQFFLYNDFHKTKTIKLPLNISEAFKQYPYEDFRGLLKAIGIKDIREAYISFKRPYVKPESKKPKHFILTEAHAELINEILEWARDWEEYQEGNKIPFTEEERHKFLVDCIRFMGHEILEASFIQEQTREHTEGYDGPYHCDDPIGYFTKRLPELLKEDKKNK